MTDFDFDLSGRIALVTGATSGIGMEIAEGLASKGCQVGIIGLGKPDDIMPILLRLQDKSGVPATYCDADLRDPSTIYKAVGVMVDTVGQVDILVNSAGVQHVAPVQDFPSEKWDEILAVNLSAVFHASKAVLPGMKRNRWGRIVNISSVHGLVGSLNKSAYVAAKHGVVGLTKVVALENAEKGITCNAICPGFVDTELVRRQIQTNAENEDITYEVAQDQFVSGKHPSRKFVNAGDICSLVLFLCSEAGASMNGAAIPIDGGWTAQ